LQPSARVSGRDLPHHHRAVHAHAEKTVALRPWWAWRRRCGRVDVVPVGSPRPSSRQQPTPRRHSPTSTRPKSSTPATTTSLSRPPRPRPSPKTSAALGSYCPPASAPSTFPQLPPQRFTVGRALPGLSA